jgi:hypothetical protein
MAKISSQNTRSLKSFGVVGLLHENCKIYYDSVFTVRHIGRISDLLVAKLKGAVPDELKFRALLLQSLYEAYRQQNKASKKKPGEPLGEPLTIECGVDAEKIVIGISFAVQEDELQGLATIAHRVADRKPSNTLETLLTELCQDADHLVFRAQPELKRVEVVSMLSLATAISASDPNERSFEVIVLGTEKPTEKSGEALKGEYIELGDLDYHRLLADDSIQSSQLPKPATGEILAGKSELETSIKLRGEQQDDSSSVTISGVTQNISEEQSRISGGQTPAVENSSTVVSGNTPLENKQVELYQQKVEQLQAKIRELEHERATSQTVISGTSAQAASQSIADDQLTVKNNNLGLRELIEKVWPFKKSAAEQPVVAQAIAAAPAAPSQPVVQEAPVAAAPVASAEAEKEEETAEEAASIDTTRKIVTDQVGSIERTITKLQAEAQDIKKVLGNPKAQKWVDGMVGELVTEKARIHEMAKKVNVSLRQKELEFRNKEHVLQEEVRKRDEQLRQKAHSFNRSREQLTQLQIQLDRIKATAPPPGEESQARQKLNLSQKLLASVKDENQGLTQKIEELKTQLATAQSASKTKTQSPDFQALKLKYERLFKQSEEFKRTNGQLMEKLNEAQRAAKSPGMNPEELKKRLDVSMRLAASYQKESEQSKLRVDELQREETRLKTELARVGNAVLMLKRASLVPKPPGSGSDSGSGEAA